jgi:hypothetical protein
MSAHLTNPESVSYRWIKIGRLTIIVFLSTAGAHLRAVKIVRRRGRGVEDAELDGDARDRLRCSSSSDSRQQLASRWSDAAALRLSSTTPAGLATAS